jgi:hypothetical protein
VQTKTRLFYSCQKCWKKIELDKSIDDYEQAKTQAQADLAYHQEHRCGSDSPTEPNKHVEISYAKKIDSSKLFLEKDNHGEIFLSTQIDQKPPFDWMPWIILGIAALSVGGILAISKLTSRDKKKSKKNRHRVVW